MSKLAYLSYLLIFLSFPALGSELAKCEGSVLERRLALVKLGEMADAYVLKYGSLPEMCGSESGGVESNGHPVLGAFSDQIPKLLAHTELCGSSDTGVIYYRCELDQEKSNVAQSRNVLRVVERCSYSLANQKLLCENKSIVAEF